MKICPKCNVPKEDSEFNKDVSTEDALAWQCRKCHSEYRKNLHLDNPEKRRTSNKNWRQTHLVGYKKISRKSRLKKVYGLSVEMFDRMIIEQSGNCKICESLMVRPNVDHCHATGKVRGLLCHNCNAGVGLFKDSPKILISAARYLKMARYLK